MICRYCGKTIPDDAAYCPFCGRRTESHLRTADRDKEADKAGAKAKKKYEEPAEKRKGKAFISILAAIVFVVAAFIIIMLFLKPHLGEEPWPDEDKQAVETEAEAEENNGFPKSMYITTEDGLTLRKEPGTDSKAIYVLNYGQEIQVEKIEGDWAYTTVGDLSGWCSAEYLTENKDDIKKKDTKPESDEDKGRLVEPSKRTESGYHGTVNSEGGLNLRCGPGSEYDIILVIPDKTEVVEEGVEGSWIFVQYDGQYGWVNSEYITPAGEAGN